MMQEKSTQKQIKKLKVQQARYLDNPEMYERFEQRIVTLQNTK